MWYRKEADEARKELERKRGGYETLSLKKGKWVVGVGLN